MALIFAARRLIPSFRSRSVVYHTRTTVSDSQSLVTFVNLEFMNGGTIGIRTVIDMSQNKRPMTNEQFDAFYTQSAAKLTAHLKSVQGFIRVFDEIIHWAEKGDNQFHIASNYGFNPLFAHGTRMNKEIKVEFFGRNTFDISFNFDTTKPELIAEGLSRLESVRSCLVEYFEKIKDLDIWAIINNK